MSGSRSRTGTVGINHPAEKVGGTLRERVEDGTVSPTEARRAKQLVDAAIYAGKLTPATADVDELRAANDLAAFEAELDSARAVIPSASSDQIKTHRPRLSPEPQQMSGSSARSTIFSGARSFSAVRRLVPFAGPPRIGRVIEVRTRGCCGNARPDPPKSCTAW